jgi:hypothetical protein
MAFDEFQEVGHRRSWALEYRFSYTTFSHAVDIIPAARSDVTLTPTDIVPTDIVSRIVSVRGQRVLLDSDLAAVYGVTTARLNQQVNRNLERFPADFIFTLTNQEVANLMLQFATSSFSARVHGGTRKPPRMFTEHGAIMAATILNSPRAVQMSVYVVRAFVKLREVLASNSSVAKRLETLERSIAALDADTRKQFDQVYEAILGLMSSGPRRN